MKVKKPPKFRKTHIFDNFINLETVRLRRSPRNHQHSTLPPNCLMVKIVNGASGFTQEAIMTFKTNKSAIYIQQINLLCMQMLWIHIMMDQYQC